MKPGRYSWQSKPSGHAAWLEMLVFIAAVLLSVFMFLHGTLSPFSPLPILAVAAWLILPRLGSRSDQVILLGFFILCFLLDDVAYGPWIEVEQITEVLGVILFRSFGITGFEAFSVGFALLCFVISSRDEKRLWLRLGLPAFLLLTSMLFLMALLAAAYGVLSGGTLETAIIQIRFLYLLPVWSFIGFVALRDAAFFRKIFFWLTILMVLKALQTVFVWASNRSDFAEAEYVNEHYTSGYLVVAMLQLLHYGWQRRPLLLKASCALAMLPLLAAYILDDRRTSYVGVPLGMLVLLAFLPKFVMRRYGRLIATVVLGFGFLTLVTWPLPVGIGALYRSFGQEAGDGGPSYRDLENANLLREVGRAPLTGMGFGKEFDEVYPMPSVATVYPRYKMIPHNNLLYTWCYGGPLTIAGLSLAFAFMFAIAGRLIFDDEMAGYRYMGVLCLFYFTQFLSYVFGDLGLQVSKNLLLAGLFLGGCNRIYQQRKRELGPC